MAGVNSAAASHQRAQELHLLVESFEKNGWKCTLTLLHIMPRWSATGWGRRRFADGPSPVTPTTLRSALRNISNELFWHQKSWRKSKNHITFWIVPLGERQWLWKSFCYFSLQLSLPRLSLLFDIRFLMMDNSAAWPILMYRRHM